MVVEPATTDHSAEIEVHARDYSGFTRLIKYAAIATFIIAMLVILIISS
ncbi:MAG: hypothetical protein ABIP91_02295 [Sphingomicrobium sp.]